MGRLFVDDFFSGLDEFFLEFGGLAFGDQEHVHGEALVGLEDFDFFCGVAGSDVAKAARGLGQDGDEVFGGFEFLGGGGDGLAFEEVFFEGDVGAIGGAEAQDLDGEVRAAEVFPVFDFAGEDVEGLGEGDFGGGVGGMDDEADGVFADFFGDEFGEVGDGAGGFFVGAFGGGFEAAGDHGDVALAFGEVGEAAAGGVGVEFDGGAGGFFEVGLADAEGLPDGVGTVDAEFGGVQGGCCEGQGGEEEEFFRGWGWI